MRVLADISLAPHDLAEPSVEEYLAECVRILEQFEVKTNIHACGINVEGQWNQVFEALEKCHQALHEMGSPEVRSTIKAETRVGHRCVVVVLRPGPCKTARRLQRPGTVATASTC